MRWSKTVALVIFFGRVLKLASFQVKPSKTRQLNRYVQMQKSAVRLMCFKLSVISQLHQKKGVIDTDISYLLHHRKLNCNVINNVPPVFLKHISYIKIMGFACFAVSAT